MKNPSFILSEKNSQAFISSLPFDTKLKLLDERLLKGSIKDKDNLDFVNKLITGIQIDLSTEQAALRRIKGAELKDQVVKEKLAKLQKLSNYPFTGSVPAGSEKAKLLAKIGASIEALSESRQSWWHMGTTNTQAHRVTTGLLKTIYGNFFLKKLHLDDDGNRSEIKQDWRASENNRNLQKGLEQKELLKKDYLAQIKKFNLNGQLERTKDYADPVLFREAIAGDAARIVSLDTDREKAPVDMRNSPTDYIDRDTRMGGEYHVERE